MGPEATTAIISGVGVVIVALIGVWTARLAKKSAEASANVEERAKIVEGYDKLNEDLQTQNTKLNEKVNALDLKVAELSNELGQHRNKITELERERDKHQRDFRTLVRYSKILIQKLRDNNIEVPAQPLEILDYGS